ncbi:MAG: dual specificity protein phosphatase family protein [Bdellovibrionales bacterium]|nr:dual specificity protein phosphatase family protein [Bdellovibrionales bacterium]
MLNDLARLQHYWFMTNLHKFLVHSLVLFYSATGLAYIPNFSRVTPEIYRGGRPQKQDFALLKSQGIRTVISLEVKSTVASEAKAVKQAGMKFLSLPMSVYDAPTNREMDTILDWLTDPMLQPVFVHCKHGEDRSGLVIGVFRVEEMDWDAESAHREMLQKGFHTYYYPLEDFFWKRVSR